MKKHFGGIMIGLLLGLIVGIFIAKILLTSESISPEYVRVTIVNSTGQTINKATLKHENEAFEIRDLSDKSEIKVIFKNVGESSYNVTALLENDSTITSKGIYIEGGYRMTETVTNKDIHTTYDK